MFLITRYARLLNRAYHYLVKKYLGKVSYRCAPQALSLKRIIKKDVKKVSISELNPQPGSSSGALQEAGALSVTPRSRPETPAGTPATEIWEGVAQVAREVELFNSLGTQESDLTIADHSPKIEREPTLGPVIGIIRQNAMLNNGAANGNR